MSVAAGGLRRVHLGSLHRHAGKPSGGVITTSTTENEFKPEAKFLERNRPMTAQKTRKPVASY